MTSQQKNPKVYNTKNGLQWETLGIILQAFLEIITAEIRKVEQFISTVRAFLCSRYKR